MSLTCPAAGWWDRWWWWRLQTAAWQWASECHHRCTTSKCQPSHPFQMSCSHKPLQQKTTSGLTKFRGHNFLKAVVYKGFVGRSLPRPVRQDFVYSVANTWRVLYYIILMFKLRKHFPTDWEMFSSLSNGTESYFPDVVLWRHCRAISVLGGSVRNTSPIRNKIDFYAFVFVQSHLKSSIRFRLKMPFLIPFN